MYNMDDSIKFIHTNERLNLNSKMINKFVLLTYIYISINNFGFHFYFSLIFLVLLNLLLILSIYKYKNYH